MHPRVFVSLLVAAIALAAPDAAFAQPAPWARGQSLGEDLEIYLVTFGPGPQVVSWFGHTALVVEDRRLSERRLFNYGMFSFDSKILGRYALGRLEFWVDATPYVADTYRLYAAEGRDVRLQRLNLSPERKLALAKALSENILPQNRYYLYHHYYDNCSTRPRDLVDAAVDGALKRAGAAPGRMTLRDHTRRHTQVSPPISVLLDFLMNDEIDKPITAWDESFLPGELETLADKATYVDGGQQMRVVAERRVLFDAGKPPLPSEPPAYGPWLLALGIGVGASALLLARSWRSGGSRIARALLGVETALVGLVLGLPGTVLLVMWLFTEHTVTHRNENLLLANPVTFAAFPLGIMLAFGSERARRALRGVWLLLSASGLVGLALKVLPLFDQDNWRIIALVLPVTLGMAGASVLYEAAPRRAVQPSRSPV
jgi:hypothetical protein